MPRSVGKSLDNRQGKRAIKLSKLHLAPRVMKNATDKSISKKIYEYFDGKAKMISEYLIETLGNSDVHQRWCK